MIKNPFVFRTVIIALGTLAALILIGRNSAFETGYIAVGLIGGAVGAVELLGRYLYAPLRAVLTPSGFSYVLVNIVAALAAFYMIGSHGFAVFAKTGMAPAELDNLKAVLLAGFGALAFMRSSLFKVRVASNDIGVGPAAILDTLLMVADRGVDRREAILRAREVSNLLKGADPLRGSKLLAAYCLGLMQNVPAEERKRIEEAVKVIVSNDDYDKDIRLDLIALELSKVVGPTVLEAAVIALGSRLTPGVGGAVDPIQAPGSTPTFQELQSAIDQAKAGPKPTPMVKVEPPPPPPDETKKDS